MVTVRTETVELPGELDVPAGARGLVLFAHGSGSSRLSPRNQYVARFLREAGLATLLFDLLTEQEERVDLVTAELRFNIDLLAQRLVRATDWALANPATKDLKIGYFGASTGAAAALIGTTQRPDVVRAIVSRGGRPDLAEAALPQVKTPTLLIVGGLDNQVIELNRHAYRQIRAEKRLEIVPGASHLFEEPGTLEEVARLARNWFIEHV